MTTMDRIVSVFAAVATIVAASLCAPARALAQGSSASAAAFPHAKHARLFLMCSSCHAGIPSGDAVRSFPSPAQCAQCHDGTVQPRVAWTAPAHREAGLLVFSHPAHLSKAKDVTCETCHSLTAKNEWMNVGHVTPERCVSCHAHGNGVHLADDNVCSTCHRTLAAATGLTEARIAALPKPPSHARGDFVGTHGAAARSANANCATCHARESCERCHVDGARAPIIRALSPDARVARLVAGRPASYPKPADHGASQFALMHGTAAKNDISRCAVCHARPSCETCHIGDGARDVLRRLPDAKEATAPGVQLRQLRPATMMTVSPPNALSLVALIAPLSKPSPPPQGSQGPQGPQQGSQITHGADTVHKVNVHPPGFLRAHGTMAGSGELQCASCHAQRFCSDCHAGQKVTRRYHPNDFVSTHAPQAYGREVDCASCHSAEAFCRSCHRQTGLAAKTNARSTVFHNAQSLWLLQHGRAARQDLTSCTTCHQQTYCMQCHSDLGARINPHGPGFDAARMSSKNPSLCLTCHFKNPLAK